MNTMFEHYASGEHLYTKITAPVCDKYGLTYMEFTILMFLANNPQYDTATEIVKYRRLTKSHVSISVRSLQQRGLLLCAHKGEDHRTIHLSLTDEASCIVEDGRLVQKQFREILFTGFSAEEEAMLMHLTERIDQNIETFNHQTHEKIGVLSHGK